MSKKQWVVGMDYSMSCPSITIINRGQDFVFQNCRAHYLSEKPPKTGFSNITATRLSEYKNNEQRFDMISDWAIQSISSVPLDDADVFIEDYSFGSKGKTFHIAENTGLVKHKLYKNGINVIPVPPTVIKKFATGKGNADKDAMYKAFQEFAGVDLMSVFQPKAAKVGSPVGDIVDSFYLCYYGFKGE